jgi:succinyl-diaminopimelate desuccinylase
MMNLEKRILSDLDSRRDVLIRLCQDLIRIPSIDRESDPPGNTTILYNYVRGLLETNGLNSTEVIVREDLPNLIAHVQGNQPGPHVVLNGHFDTFGLGDRSLWTYDPFGGDLVEGKIYGRGAADMKGGDAALIMVFLVLAEYRNEWPGTLTLTLFSDEETGAKFGAEHIVKNNPEVRGDVVLSGEPSGLRIIRFGEKGASRLTFRAYGQSGHSPYPASGRNAIDILMDFLTNIRNLAGPVNISPEWIKGLINKTTLEIDALYGQGSSRFLSETTVNTGVFHGGQKDSLIPHYAEAMLDIRTPIGQTHEDVMLAIRQILERHPCIEVDVRHWRDPNYSDPQHPLFKIIQQSVKEVTGDTANLACMFGGTDCRFWRRLLGTPCAVYGPTPHHIGSENEYIEVEDLIKVAKVHALSITRLFHSAL